MIEHPRIGFVGIHAGGKPGRVVSQNETLANCFLLEGAVVRMCSAVRRPFWRTVHHVLAILSWWRKIDVMVVAVFSGPSFFIAELAVVIGRAIRCPVVLVLHGGKLPDLASRSPRRVQRTLRQAAAVVAPSRFLADALRDSCDRISVIPNVVDLAAIEFRRRVAPRPSMLWMRTFHPHYDPQLAIEVLRRVRVRFSDCVLTMAGADHGLLAATKKLADSHDLQGSVNFPGYLNHSRKLSALARHDFFINTNVVDNMPVSVIEACASGMLIVATSVGGLPYLLTDALNGRLLPAGDAEAMAKAVIGLVEEPDRAATMSAAARALAEQSSWEQVRPEWQRLFLSVAARSHRSLR